MVEVGLNGPKVCHSDNFSRKLAFVCEGCQNIRSMGFVNILSEDTVPFSLAYRIFSGNREQLNSLAIPSSMLGPECSDKTYQCASFIIGKTGFGATITVMYHQENNKRCSQQSEKIPGVLLPPLPLPSSSWSCYPINDHRDQPNLLAGM